MLCFRTKSLLACLGLVFITGCDGEEPLSYCAADTPCPAGQVCDLATNTCLPADAGVNDGLAPDLNLKNGTKCNVGGECKSGFCADNLCCDAKCGGTCKSCGITGKEGTCALVASGKDPRKDCAGKHKKCGGTCDGKGACSYAPSTTKCGDTTCKAAQLTTKLCDGKGDCKSTTKSCGGFACNATGDACKTKCATVADCAATFQCVAEVCVGNLKNGKHCETNNKACASGNCVDGVCCSAPACTLCSKCNISGKEGDCTPQPDLTSCGTAKCISGAKTEKVCKTGNCTTQTKSCGTFACNIKADDCLKNCSTNADCAPTAYCKGTLCVSALKTGAVCTSGPQCLSGSCVDGVCCSTASCALCSKCNISGKEGTCSPVKDKTVCGKPYCSSSVFGQDVQTKMLCKSGKCVAEPLSCGHYLCNAAKTACEFSCKTHKNCYTSTSYCDKGSCLAKKSDGKACKTGDECKNYFCEDGYCCDKSCSYECEACNLKGKEGKCNMIAKGTSCGQDKCNNGFLSKLECSGLSASCKPSYFYCEPYKCNTAKTACATSCAKSDQCSSGHCDTTDVLGAKGKCIKTSQMCWVHTGACGDGSKAKPACAIQKCLDKKARYVLVADGKYSENLVIKDDVAIISTGTSGALLSNGLPKANVAKVFLTPTKASTAGISISGKQKVYLYGLDISHASAGASGDLVHILGADNVTLETCAVHDGKGQYSGGITILQAKLVSLKDVALYKFESNAFFSYDSTLVDFDNVGVAFATKENVQVNKGTLRMRDVLVATGGTAGISVTDAKLDLDRVRTQLNNNYGFLANDCTGHVSNLLAANNNGHGVFLKTNTCPLLTNITVADNAPKNLAVYDIYCHANCKAKVSNSIVWSDSTSQIKYSMNCQFSYSDVKTAGTTPVSGTKNLNTKPLFTGTGVHPYAIAGSSPCVDAGSDSALSVFSKRDKDLQGLPRQVDKAPGGAKVDMGAYEAQ